MNTRLPIRAARQSLERLAIARAGRRHAGFTLLELMIALTVSAVLFAIAIPSFTYVTASNRVASEINGLLGDIQFARAEAVKRGQTVTICSSTDGATCSGTNTWTFGWIVFNDANNNQVVDAASGEVVLRVQTAMGAGDTMVANNAIKAVTFNREGFAINMPGTITLTLNNATAVAAYSRCLAMTQIGQITPQIHGQGACL